MSWNLLAGIGRIESLHANGGATDARGTAVRPIYGPTLDGTLPGNEVIVQSRSANRVTYARAMGPMQFLPGTWSRYASDGDGDGKADVQNVFDSSLAAARYLCSGGLNLRDPVQVMTAILRYNNSVAYARNVLGWAAAYATGVVPVNLPPITGPVPPLGDAHLDNYRGPRARTADERHRAARRRSAGLDAVDGTRRRREPDSRLSRSGPGTAAWATAGTRAARGSAAAAGAACTAAVAATPGCSPRRSRNARPNARCSVSRRLPRRLLRPRRVRRRC